MKPLREPGRFRIKQAALEELEDLARLKVEVWRQASDVDESVVTAEQGAVPRTAASWREVCAHGGYLWAVTDTGDEGRFVGLAHAGISRDPDAARPLELTMLHLLDQAKGSGIADRLLQMAIGDAPAQIWVGAGNDRAIHFFRRHGFTEDGLTRTSDRLDITEVRMVR